MERLKAAQSTTFDVVIFQKPDLGGSAETFIPATIQGYIKAGETAVPSFGTI